MKFPIRTFEANTAGRDFAVGDMHGAYQLFEKMLLNLKFDPTKDRMFSVGDLVDRGPESMRCLRLIYEPWFNAVVANHEQMMYECFHGGFMGQFWFENGGHWGIEHYNDWRMRHARTPADESAELFDLLEQVRELPLLMTVKLLNGKQVHIIHAELPYWKSITDEDLADPVKFYRLATEQSRDGDFVTWGRYLFRHFYEEDLSNTEKNRRIVKYHFTKTPIANRHRSHIISGHTILQRPMTILGHTNIDTKAYAALRTDAKRWNALTCLELNTWKFYQATATEFREVAPCLITEAGLISQTSINLDAPPLNIAQLLGVPTDDKTNQ